MQKQIGILKELQQNDNKISRMQQDIEVKKAEINNLRDEFEKKTNDLTNKEEEKKKVNMKKHELELNVDTIDNKIKKLKEQQFNVKTNKEYSALLKEVDDLNEEKNNVEDQILQQMELLDELDDVLKKIKKELEEDEKILLGDVKEKEKEISVSEELIKTMEQRKEELLDSLKQDFKASYNVAWSKYKGEAVVMVKNNTCQGCFMTLPPQIVNEVLMAEKVIICENCGRILVSDLSIKGQDLESSDDEVEANQEGS